MPKKRRNNGRRSIGIIPIKVAAGALWELGFGLGMAELRAGDYSGALAAMGTYYNTPEDYSKQLIKGIGLGIARRAVGRVPLISGRKYSLTML